MNPNAGNFQISNLDEARDQWSHRFARREQQDLLKKAFAARFVNRNAASGRGLVFLSGDIHIGCIFDVSAARPSGKAVSLTSSGISQIDDTQPLVGTFIDEEFSLARASARPCATWSTASTSASCRCSRPAAAPRSRRLDLLMAQRHDGSMRGRHGRVELRVILKPPRPGR